ncbi:hypothetical protein [Methylobacterium fujisawaense]|uniref:hypothetical protein n=1 Tax=Methylobacterium fujisawaense TaxID=107400 RepID=UPI002F35CC43
MGIASIYILNVRPDRRSTLLNADRGYFGRSPVTEAVPAFAHSRKAPLIVLASFEDGLITHVGEGRKGASAGTGLVRLNMNSLEELGRPISFELIIASIEPKFRGPLRKTIAVGGLLSPKTQSAVVAALSEMDERLRAKLVRLSETRRALIAELGIRERENLALQKEALTAALEIAGVGTADVLEWTPETDERTSFLDGLSGARVREDVMLHADMMSLPGFAAIQDAPHIAARTFAAEGNPDVRVTVIMANRLPLEEQTGSDLIYFNEAFRSFVFVQYKALEKIRDQPEFRWADKDQFSIEIERMDGLIEKLDKLEPDLDPNGFRLTSNPFLLKFCSRVVFNPDDRGLFPGIYLPLGLWKMLASSGRLKGSKGGNLLTYANVGRRLSGPEFVSLVAGSWVGTTISQSKSLEKLIRDVIEGGRTVTFAVKHRPLHGKVGFVE